MAQRAAVPKFGNWESEDNVPYTTYFEKARKSRSGGKVNRIDSQPNSDTNQASSFQSESRTARKEHHLSYQEIDLRRMTDSPLQNGDVNQGTNPLREKHQRRLGDSTMHHDTIGVSSGDTRKRATLRNAASDVSIEQLLLHQHGRSKLGGKVNEMASLSWEKKVSSEGTHGLAPVNPGRSQLRSSTRDDDSLDQSAAVPKFGDWDETDPTSADGFTHIFNKVREERYGGAAKAPNQPGETSQKQYRNEKSTSWCCFLWGGR